MRTQSQELFPFSKNLQRSDFTAGTQIGQGAYGTVFKVKFNEKSKEAQYACEEKSGQFFALKELFFNKLMADNRVKEIFIERQVLMHLDHPSVIKFHCSFRNLNKLYILLEYCAHGSLQDFLILKKTLSLPLARHMTSELVDALEYLRNNQIVHRDLKPGNVVLDKDYHLKLIDFGTCKLFNSDILSRVLKMEMIAKLGGQAQADMFRTFSLVGTEDYISPEVLQDLEVTYACDLWSLGVILYQMLHGSTPFKGKTPEETYSNIRQCNPEQLQFKSTTDAAAKDLIKSLLQPDPAKRLGARSITDLKAHPFFSQIAWDSVRLINVPYVPPQMLRRNRTV